jgi:rfaE bifunctional protein kinase chain/domain
MGDQGNYKKLFEDFNNQNILIIGDVMVDSYLWGNVERISPEAPIPIVALKKREYRMGGAANVAMNIKAMGANPILCSIIGNDENATVFLDLLEKENIESYGLIQSFERLTTTKYRIFGNNTQMLRVDEETEDDINKADMTSMLEVVDSILAKEHIDCVIFQDYNKGVLCVTLVKEVISKARKLNIPIAVDPKKKNFEAFTGATLFKPNLKELKEGLRIDLDYEDRETLIRIAQSLREKLKCEYILATLSERGVLICSSDNMQENNIYIPAHVRSIADVSGAGDTVISVASLCLAEKRSPYEIAYISNLAGGLVCEDVGVVPINKEKLLKEVLALL